jgi:hypothetical protein
MSGYSAGVPLPLEGRVAAQRPDGVVAAVLYVLFGSDPALRYGSGRSSFEKPNRWLFVAAELYVLFGSSVAEITPSGRCAAISPSRGENRSRS